MDALRSIVVGVDFTPCAAAALGQAIRLAAASRARIHVAHIVDTLVAVSLTEELTSLQAEVTAGLLREAKEAWRAFCAGIPGAAELAFHVDVGSPAASLSRLCVEQRADLLVLGTHGHSPAERGTGTMATQCVRRAPVNVLLVHDSATGSFKNVLACVDFSPASKQAVDEALRLAAVEGAVAHVLYVFTSPWEHMKMKAGAPEAAPAMRVSYARALQRQLEVFCGPARPEVTWAKPAFHAIPGENHGRAICAFARMHDVDLVVMGARGHTNLRDVLLGSTAERVVRHAQRSVLAIRPKG